MHKGTHFIGQPLYGQLINLLDKDKILKISRENGGERYVKHFDAWQHLVIMLYAVIRRFDSFAGNNRLHVSRGKQTRSSRSKAHAETQYPVRCQRKETGMYL